MAKIRTVLGDIDPDQAGVTLTHEHIRYAYAGHQNDHRQLWTVESLADNIAPAVKSGRDDFGITTLVDMTPPEIGRHPELLAEVSRRSSTHIVAIAGFFPQVDGMGIPYHWRRMPIDYIAEELARDITEGMVYDGRLTPYKAGMLKAATGGLSTKQAPLGVGGRHIGFFEDRVVRAIARAQRKTGVAINTHTQPMEYKQRNPGLELLDLLEEEGADPSRVIIGHAFVHPDIDQLVAICERGACLQIDHIGIPWQHDSADELDELIANAVCELADRGHLDRLVFSYDRFFSYVHGAPGEPDLLNETVPVGYIFQEFAPRLAKKGFGKAELNKVLVENPKRLLAF
jgi:phosphotriesterase-related protein